MSTFGRIVASGAAMSLVALVGSTTLLLSDRALDRILLALVGFAAGSLLGGAMFPMFPAALSAGIDPAVASGWFAAGFTAFFALEQLLHRHHCRRASAPCRQPVTYLILLGDALHNFLGGLAVASAFVLHVRTGILTWPVAVTHEIPKASLTDLIPEANRSETPRQGLVALSAFVVGLALLRGLASLSPAD